MLAETFRLALTSIRDNRLRSSLTVLGIVFGVMAVISTVAIVQGVFSVFTSQLEELGAGFLFAVAGNPTAADKVRLDARLTADDAKNVEEWAPSVDATSPFFGEVRPVRKSDRTTQAFLSPVNEKFSSIQGFYVDEGRFLTALDVRQRAHVAVVGVDVVKKLSLNGVGDEVRIWGSPFKIIGVFEAKDGFNAMGQRYDQLIAVPFTAAASFTSPIRGGIMLIKLDDTNDVEQSKNEIKLALRRAHHLEPGEPDDFTLISQGEILESVGQVTTAATWVVVAIVGIALLVGGIGIMNIMLVSVTERTKEIGIRMAVGARRQDILVQFVVEASVLGAAGGVVGVVLGYAVAYLVSALVPEFPAPIVPIWSVVLALGFSSGTGLFFGLYPAARAARLDPIEALRYE